jgi:methylated-DNA-[protein]-cysteine S-methyltransferase
MTAFATVPSPVGPLALEAQAGRLTAVRFDEGHHATAPTEAPELAAAATQLEHYFSGRRRTFELPLAPPVGPFDRRVLGALTEIPYSERISYGELTTGLGIPTDDVRKVAAAVGRNPLPILIPCHRVVGADGGLAGYGGGLVRKAQLLALEAGQLQLAV